MIHASQSKSYSLQMRVEVKVHCLLTFHKYIAFSPCAVTGRLGKEFPKNWRCHCKEEVVPLGSITSADGDRVSSHHS